jgi:hypothetical protein
VLTEEYGKPITGGEGPTSYDLIRPDMVDALRRYVFRGVLPGDFLTAVLENNLQEAVGHADHDNIRAIPAWVSLIYNDCPSLCWGSREAVAAWPERAAHISMLERHRRRTEATADTTKGSDEEEANP